MTVATTTSTVTYQGNSSTTQFTFPFIGVAASDLVVTYTSNGFPLVLDPTQYTITLNSPAIGSLWGIGGTVTYPLVGSPIAAGTFLSITRSVPYTQSVSISNQGSFYPQAVEQGLDLLELQIQQLATDFQYSLQFPVTDLNPPAVLPPAAARANQFLYFDSSGQPTVVPVVPQGGGGGGSSANPRRVITTGTATINVLTSDALGGISIYQSSTPVTTVQLPTSSGPYPIFDGTYNASNYPITILPPAGKTIQGQSSYVLNQTGGSVEFYIDTSEVLVG